MQKDKGLVSAKEVAKAINIDKLGFLGTFGGWMGADEATPSLQTQCYLQPNQKI